MEKINNSVRIGYSIKVEDSFSRYDIWYYIKALALDKDNEVIHRDVVTTLKAEEALTFATLEEATQYAELFKKDLGYQVRFNWAEVVKVLTPGGDLNVGA